MDFAVAFFVFLGSMTVSMVMNISVVVPLLIGFVLFYGVGYCRGNSIGQLAEMAKDGVRTSMVVIKLLLMIGCITSLWRACGTIPAFLYYGISLVTPRSFILIAFLLTAVLSYLLGSSFAVIGTAGVLLMILGDIGGVNLPLVAGAVMSGSYFGDRTSRVSSSMFLTATMAHVDKDDYADVLFKTGIVPFVITTVIYGVLSFNNPLTEVNSEVLDSLYNSFHISFWSFVPALLLLILPWFKIGMAKTLFVTIALSVIVGAVVEGLSANEMAVFILTGYEATEGPLGDTLNGGGIVSMGKIICVIVISASYAGLFEATKMLDPVKDKVVEFAGRFGNLAASLMVSVTTILIFCNQTIPIIMTSYMTENVYKASKLKADNMEGCNEYQIPLMEMASDIGNTLITLCATVPWSVACIVPLLMLGSGPEAVPWSFFLWLNPLCYIFTKKFFVKKLKMDEYKRPER